MLIIENPHMYYIDPGTISYIFQALLAIGIGIGLYFKNLKDIVTVFIKKFFNK